MSGMEGEEGDLKSRRKLCLTPFNTQSNLGVGELPGVPYSELKVNQIDDNFKTTKYFLPPFHVSYLILSRDCDLSSRNVPFSALVERSA